MRKLLFLCFIFFLSHTAFTQTDPIRQQLDYLFGSLDASQVPSGYLAPYGTELLDKEDYNGLLTDSNLVNDLDLVRMAYADIYSSRFYSNAPSMVDIDALNSTIASVADNSLVLFYGQYSLFDENAVANNWLQYTNGKLYDVAGRPQSPYILKNLFIAYPKNNYFNETVVLSFNPSLFYTNTNLSVQSLQVDFGGGYQTINVNGNSSYTYTDNTGWHTITLKITLSNSTVLYTKMGVWVKVTPGSSTARYRTANLATPDIDIAPVTGVHSGLRAYIRRSINTSGTQIRKPLIVVEGFDINDGAPRLANFNYNVNMLIDEWESIQFGNPQQRFTTYLDDLGAYDLIFIDWKNSTDDIPHNAVALEDLIGRINTMKANSGYGSVKNVVMGISMGGLITRYCLASMTKRNVDPQTRLLLTQDSPHQGAYVPLALQHLVKDLQNQRYLGIIRFGSVFKAVDEAADLLNKPAVQQELMMYVTDGNGTVVQNSFLSTTYRNMITFSSSDPQPQYQFMAVSDGSQCGNGSISAGATLINGAFEFNASGPVSILTNGIVSKSRLKIDADLKALTGSSSHKILFFKFQRKEKYFWGLINGSYTILELNRFEPSFNTIPWESVPGGFESLGDRLGTGNGLNGHWGKMWFLGYNYNFSLAPRFGFVPTVSSLDVVAVNNTTVFEKYIQGITPSNALRAADFIAQESFVENNITQYNRQHTDFSARNSEWIFDRMQGLSFNDCYRSCGPNSFIINGNGFICNSELYNLTPTPSGSGVIWSAFPSGYVNINANGSQATITAISSGNVTITANVTDACTNLTTSVSKTVHSGTYGSSDYPISGPSTGSCGSSLYFNTVDLPGATNYQWFWPSGWTYYSGQGTRFLTVQPPSYGSSSGVVGVRVDNACGTGGSPATRFVQISCGGGGYYYYSVSPNPATSKVTVSSKDEKTTEKHTTITELNIYDQQSALRKSQKFNKVKNGTIDIGNLPVGIYIIEIIDGDYKERQQLSIVK
jgi:hypothetical protein